MYYCAHRLSIRQKKVSPLKWYFVGIKEDTYKRNTKYFKFSTLFVHSEACKKKMCYLGNDPQKRT